MLLKKVRLKSYSLLSIILLSSLAQVQAADITWTNSAGGNWTTAANWDPNQTPSASDTAIITNTGEYTVTASSSVSIASLILGNGSTNSAPLLVISSTFSPESAIVESNASVQFSGNLAGGNFVNRGYFEWRSGTLSGTNDFVNDIKGHVYLATSSTKNLRRPLQNHGLLEFNTSVAHLMKLRDSGTFTNHTDGEVTFRNNAGFDLDTGNTTECAFANFGTVTASGSGQSPSRMGAPFFNFGTLEVPGVCMVGDGTNYGVLDVPSSSGQIQFRLGDYTLEEGTELLGEGYIFAYETGTLRVNTPLVTSNAFGTGNIGGNTPNLYLNASMTNLNLVTMGRGRFYITNPAVVLDAKTFNVNHYLTNAGTVIADTLNMDNSLSGIDNAGTVILRSNFYFNRNTFDQRPNGHLITEAGCSTDLDQAANNTTRNLVGGLWDNYGTVTIPPLGSLNTSSGAGWINHSNGVIIANGNGLVSNSGGTNWFVNYGTWERSTLASSPTWALVTTNYGIVSAISTIMSFGDYYQFDGVTDLHNSTINTARFNIFGGELRGKADVGSDSSFYNDAEFHPGSEVGTFQLRGPFTNDAAGTYHMEIGGNNSSDYDTVEVTGTAYLAGSLNVILTNGFFPNIGNTFTAMTYTNHSGEFDEVVSPDYQFRVEYTPTALLLHASNALPSVTLTVGGGSTTQLVCNPFSLQAAASDLDGSITNLALSLNGSPLAMGGSSSLSSLVEYDFPSTISIAATATDNLGGTRTYTQEVHMVTLPLRTLMLGGFRTNGFKICMLGEDAANYATLMTTNLPATSWVNIGPMTFTNGIFRYFDATPTNAHRFYKAVELN